MRVLKVNNDGMFIVVTKNLSVVYNCYNAPVAIVIDNNMLVHSHDEYYESEINAFFDTIHVVKVINRSEFTAMIDNI